MTGIMVVTRHDARLSQQLEYGRVVASRLQSPVRLFNRGTHPRQLLFHGVIEMAPRLLRESHQLETVELRHLHGKARKEGRPNGDQDAQNGTVAVVVVVVEGKRQEGDPRRRERLFPYARKYRTAKEESKQGRRAPIILRIEGSSAVVVSRHLYLERAKIGDQREM